MCHNSCQFPIAYIGPKNHLRYKGVCSVSKGTFLERGVCIPSPNPKAGEPPFVIHLRLLIQHTCMYPPYLEVLSIICNPRTHLAMVTGTHMVWTDEYKYTKLFQMCSCCWCETLMKLSNMHILGYVLFVLHAPHSVGIYQIVNPNNTVSHPKIPHSPRNTTVRASKLV